MNRKLTDPMSMPSRWTVGAALLMVAVVLRYLFIDVRTVDYFKFLQPWFQHLARYGWAGLADDFSNYMPPYLYLLYGIAQFQSLAADLHLIKALSIVFDGAAAAWTLALIRLQHPHGSRPLLGFCAVLAAPTVVLNGAALGQSDVIYSAFLVAGVFLVCRGRGTLAVGAMAIAFSFKAQALFIAPFVAMMLIAGKLRWGSLLIAPFVVSLLLLPAWLAGRPLRELLTIYVQQAEHFHNLSRNAANPYYFIPDTLYEPVVVAGLCLAATVCLGAVAAAWRSRAEITTEGVVVLATAALTIMPFVLPKMHERYFFPAELLSIALAFSVPRLWVVPAALQVSGVLAYMPFMLGVKVGMPFAVAINAMVVARLLLEAGRVLYPDLLARPARSSVADL